MRESDLQRHADFHQSLASWAHRNFSSWQTADAHCSWTAGQQDYLVVQLTEFESLAETGGKVIGKLSARPRVHILRILAL